MEESIESPDLGSRYTIEPEIDKTDSEGIIAHMNEDHADALVLYARAFGAVIDATEAVMLGIDTKGMNLKVRTPSGSENIRIALPEPLSSGADARRVLVDMVNRARQMLGA